MISEWVILAALFLLINVIFWRFRRITTDIFWMLNIEMIFVLGVVWVAEPWVA